VLPNLSLTISIVTYHTPAALLESLWSTIVEAMDRVSAANISCGLTLMLVDNSEPPDPAIDAFRVRHSAASIRVLRAGGNIGFGAGHNLAVRNLESDFHLVLNPDVKLAPDAILEALRFMTTNPACGLLAPAVYDGEGKQQFLCKRYPAVLDFTLRGFAPQWLKRLFRQRLDRYELRDQVGDSVLWDPAVVSGSFMFFRTAILERLDGFDPRFFLYLEDFDLTLRAAKITRVAYVPQVRITHYGGHAARKGLRHVKMFVTAAFRFYNKNGWKWL
jgi:GT2 family glycosyltransferase